jgi:hypothetical protein
MWTTVALMALSLAPGQPGQLALTHVRSTYGVMGAPRPDNKVLPGDTFVLGFNIEGAKVSGGKVLYSIGMEVNDAAGKTLFRQAPQDLEAPAPAGGGSLPASASIQIGLDQPPGEYTLKVTVNDRSAKTSQTITKNFQVLPKAFGLVRLSTTSDREGQIAASSVKEGSTLWVNVLVVGFGRDPGTGQPRLVGELRVLDADGKPVLPKPFGGQYTEKLPEKAQAAPWQVAVPFGKAGQYTVQLKVTDQTTGQTTGLAFPITVTTK